MLVFHGAYCPIQKPQIVAGKYAKDFGTGFYCTRLKEQAVRWAKRYTTPVLNRYAYEGGDSLRVLQFETMTEEWLDFIVACRTGIPHDYDIVIGAMRS
jgi:hypothetical protein